MTHAQKVHYCVLTKCVVYVRRQDIQLIRSIMCRPAVTGRGVESPHQHEILQSASISVGAYGLAEMRRFPEHEVCTAQQQLRPPRGGHAAGHMAAGHPSVIALLLPQLPPLCQRLLGGGIRRRGGIGGWGVRYCSPRSLHSGGTYCSRGIREDCHAAPADHCARRA